MTTYIYCRTSTTDQNVEQQAAYLMGKYPGFDHVICEQASGKTLDRPKFDKVRKSLRNGDTLVVQDMSRLGRNLREILEFVEECQQHGITLVLADLGADTSTPSGKLIASILGAVAEMLRGQMLEKQAIGIERAKKEGKYKGRAAIPAPVIAAAKKLKAEGMPAYKIAKQLKVSSATAYKYLSD
jgi:DNA invertase Pin-like site-specific DNA recombinase